MCILFQDTRAPSGPGSPHYRVFTITLRHTTLSKTPLDKWPARHRDLYLTTHKTHNRNVSMPPTRFEPAIPASERPHNHAFERAATGTGRVLYIPWINKFISAVPKVWSADPKRSATSSLGIRGYSSVMATLKFPYFFS
jgi:hypothetical protein